MKQYFARLSSLERRFVVGVLVVVFIVLNAMFVWPRFSDWGKMRVRLDKARRTLALYETNIAQMPKYEKEVKIMESESPAVPLEDQAIEFVKTIQSQAAQSGVRIGPSSPQPSRGTNLFFVEKAHALTLEPCEEKELVDFLYKLGAGNSLIRVRDLNLLPDQPRQRLAANIKLVASYQRKPAARPAAPASAPAPAPAAAQPRPVAAEAAKPPTPTAKKP